MAITSLRRIKTRTRTCRSSVGAANLQLMALFSLDSPAAGDDVAFGDFSAEVDEGAPPDSPNTTPNSIEIEEAIVVEDADDDATVAARRKAKGKGRAVEREGSVATTIVPSAQQKQHQQQQQQPRGRAAAMDADVRGIREEMERMRKELATKNEVSDLALSSSLLPPLIFDAVFSQLLVSQQNLIQNVRSSLSCTICLETLDSPYALSCGWVSLDAICAASLALNDYLSRCTATSFVTRTSTAGSIVRTRKRLSSDPTVMKTR